MNYSKSRYFIFKLTYIAILLLVSSVVFGDPIYWSPGEGGNGHFYEAIATPEGCTWDQALAGANSKTWQGQQGYLATITSAAENVWLWEALGHPAEYRLGGYQPSGSIEPGGGWTWLTGEQWDYENWLGKNPDDGGNYDNEGTLGFHASTTTGEWNDRWSDILCYGYIVEYNEGAVPVDDSTWGVIKALFLKVE